MIEATVGDRTWIGAPREKGSNTRHICGQAALFSGKYAPKNLHWSFKPEQQMQGGLRRASEAWKAQLIRLQLTHPKCHGTREAAKALFKRVNSDSNKLRKLAVYCGVSEGRFDRALKTSGWLLAAMIALRGIEKSQ